MTAQIGIVIGSHSDLDRIRKGLDRLRAFEVPFEMCIASAHRTPERLEAWLCDAEERGLRVVIAGAGAAAHLPGVVASKTLLPVIGIPLNATPLQGQDALLSIVQMPPGIPVATVGIDSAENAVVLAMQILAITDPAIREKLRRFRTDWKEKIAEQNEKLYKEYPDARPGVSFENPALTAESPAPRKGKTTKSGVRRKLDPDNPALDAIEEAVDVLLDGGVVGIPTDTVYGISADATNQHAVQKLYQIKDRDPKKPIAVLVDSLQLARTLIEEPPPEIEELIARFWPGPLTIVARKKRGMLQAVSLAETIGLRMPDNMVALSLINMLARPLATSSANTSGHDPALDADEVIRQLGENVNLVLDSGPTSIGEVSTVLSMVERPFAILREGAVTREMLKEVLGDQLQ